MEALLQGAKLVVPLQGGAALTSEEGMEVRHDLLSFVALLSRRRRSRRKL